MLGQCLGETYTATWSGRPENKQQPGPKALPRDALSNRDEAGPHGLAGVGDRGESCFYICTFKERMAPMNWKTGDTSVPTNEYGIFSALKGLTVWGFDE